MYGWIGPAIVLAAIPWPLLPLYAALWLWRKSQPAERDYTENGPYDRRDVYDADPVRATERGLAGREAIRRDAGEAMQ